MLPLYSPTSLRDFIWVANYTDGSFFTEFDYHTKDKNDFNSIRKHDLINFGLVGHGFHFYHDAIGGTFHLPQGKIDFKYVIGNQTVNLTNNFDFCNDIITYKKAHSTFSPLAFRDSTNTNIEEYVFGYKKKVVTKEFESHVKLLFHIPFGSPMYLSIRLVADRDVDGKLQILRNGIITEEIGASLYKDMSAEINWEVY
ncbi:hypothetical protein EDM57_21105 [Brevibacillus gelatini]|uniref:Uncharacterized protein n=1 Tax=Brevibacillus gelatini TaxID=1655277 RepID=A0A3M8ANA7_9BACL|nr:hypothetical protein [Brevibacillus gelatini]RNB52688.1 hypothetical protein EDM57_21105 [Brevibacillus gelatini]